MNKLEKSQNFLGYIHSFRGFAIFNIVAIHAFIPGFLLANNYEIDFAHPFFIFNEVLFHDSTLYFALISGLLYTAILRPRGYTRFYRSKFYYVILPYLFFTLLFSLGGPDGFVDSIQVYAQMVLYNLLTGNAMFHLWYIPVLLFLFAITPLLDFLLYHPRWKVPATFLLLMLPLFFSRTAMVVSPNTFLFFTGCYSAGMLLGQNVDGILRYLDTQRVLLITIATLSSLTLFVLFIYKVQHIAWVDIRESIFYIQKLSLSILVLQAFKARGSAQPPWLFGLARDSFAIYFLHAPLVFSLGFIWSFLFKTPIPEYLNILWVGVFTLIVGIAICRLITAGLRKLMGQNSRMLVGS